MGAEAYVMRPNKDGQIYTSKESEAMLFYSLEEALKFNKKHYSGVFGVEVKFEWENPLDEALRLLRDLAEHQNGPPLLRHEEEYNKTMAKVWKFLKKHESDEN